METINVAFVGEVSTGKTTIISAIIQCIAGTIKKKQSTNHINSFTESITPIEPNEMKNEIIKNDVNIGDKIQMYEWNIPKIAGINIPYKFNIIDFPALPNQNLMKKIREIIHNIDVLCIVLDVSKDISEQIYDSIDVPIKLFILNKFDDAEDDELCESRDNIIETLETPNIITLAGYDAYLCRIYEKYGYNVFNNTEKTKAIKLNIEKTHSDLLKTCGFNNLLQKLESIILENKNVIFERKTKYLCNGKVSIAEIVHMCNKYNDILHLDITKTIDKTIENWCWNFVMNDKFDEVFEEVPDLQNISKLQDKYEHIVQRNKEIEIKVNKCKSQGFNKKISKLQETMCEECKQELTFELINKPKDDESDDDDEQQKIYKVTCICHNKYNFINRVYEKLSDEENFGIAEIDDELYNTKDFIMFVCGLVGITKLNGMNVEQFTGTNILTCIIDILNFVDWTDNESRNHFMFNDTIKKNDKNVVAIYAQVFTKQLKSLIEKDTSTTITPKLYEYILDVLQDPNIYKTNKKEIHDLFYMITLMEISTSVDDDGEDFIPFTLQFKKFISDNKIHIKTHFRDVYNLKYILPNEALRKIYIKEIFVKHVPLDEERYWHPTFITFMKVYERISKIISDQNTTILLNKSICEPAVV